MGDRSVEPPVQRAELVTEGFQAEGTGVDKLNRIPSVHDFESAYFICRFCKHKPPVQTSLRFHQAGPLESLHHFR